MEECPICYETKPLTALHACSHSVCNQCLIHLVKHGLHHECSYCRAPLEKSYTIGVSTVGGAVAMLVDDDGAGILIKNNESLEKISGCTTPVRMQRLLGTHAATVVRLAGKTILYGAVVETRPRYLDCFFKVPMSSEDSRRGRALRRKLMRDSIISTTITEEQMPLWELMRTLVFPVLLIDVVDPPELEEVTDGDYEIV